MDILIVPIERTLILQHDGGTLELGSESSHLVCAAWSGARACALWRSIKSRSERPAFFPFRLNNWTKRIILSHYRPQLEAERDISPRCEAQTLDKMGYAKITRRNPVFCPLPENHPYNERSIAGSPAPRKPDTMKHVGLHHSSAPATISCTRV